MVRSGSVPAFVRVARKLFRDGEKNLRQMWLPVVAIMVLELASVAAGAQVTQLPSWTNQVANGQPGNPSARNFFSMAYDAANAQVVIYGGNISPGFNDTWTWDGLNWTQQHPAMNPSYRQDPMMAYDAANQQVVLFGGQGSGPYMSDTWIWDGKAKTWTQQTVTNSPSGRSAGMMAYDAANQQMVLFGGLSPSGYYNDTWMWDGATKTWTQQIANGQSGSPSQRIHGMMAYDAAHNQIVLFGGLSISGTLLNDTWTWDGSTKTWTQQQPSTSPSARDFGGMAYGSARGQIVLFGGMNNSNQPIQDTWTWDGSTKTWTQQHPPANPPPTGQGAMAYDIAHDQIVLFGGFEGTPINSLANTTWTFQEGALNIGAANVCPSGATTPSPCIQKRTVYFDVAAGSTIGSIKFLTQGAGNLDFKASSQSSDTSTSPCVAQVYEIETTCKVDVTFAPTRPGLRNGAVQILDANNTVLDTVYTYGTGTGPQLAFLPVTQHALGSGLQGPQGVTVDGSGNVYVLDSKTTVTKIPTGCTSSACVTALGGGLSNPSAVAVDGVGNLYVADKGNGFVKEIPAGCTTSSCVTTLGGVNNPIRVGIPQGVAVDGAGNVYIADSVSSSVKKIPAECTTSNCITTLGGVNNPITFDIPQSLAVDGSGNIYVADAGSNVVKEIPAECTASSCVIRIGSGLNSPEGVAVDAAGNVYVANAGASDLAVLEIPAGCTSSSCEITLGAGFSSPYGVAVDAAGNIYVADSKATTVTELDVANPPILNFAPTKIGSISSDSPKTVTLENIGNAVLNLAANVTRGLNPSSFTLDNTGCPRLNGNDSPPAGLASAASCTLSVGFAPQAVGSSVNGSVSLTDNNLNANPDATQAISLSGTIVVNPIALPGSGALPAPTYQVPYSAPINASDGKSPYSFSITGGSLPPGLMLSKDGALSGTPTGAGSFNFTITATDAEGTTGTETYSLAVNKATAKVSLSDTNVGYSGAPVSLIVTTDPSGLNVSITYNGSPTAPTATGTYSIVATVNDPNYSGTATGTLTIASAATPTITTLTVSSDAISAGQSATFTAQVKSTTTGTPTGSVSFYDGITLLGTSSLNNGLVSFSTTTLAVGASHVISATYAGDTTFSASTSPSTTVTVGAPFQPSQDFTLNVSGASTQTATAGGSVRYTFQVSPGNGAYLGPVNFTATGLPQEATAMFSPASIAEDGGAQTVTLTVQTAASTEAASNPFSRNASLAMCVLLLPFIGIRRMRRGTLLTAIALVGLTFLTGCGGHSDSNSSSSSSQSSRSYTITVTATSATISHNFSVTLTEN